MFDEEYGVTAAAYLVRARQALQSGRTESLFYAALEMRCCIEARQAEYAQALHGYQGTKIKAWRIAETGQKIRQRSYADRICMVSYKIDGEILATTFHTPVTDELIKIAEATLGELLHAQARFRPSSDSWWGQTRDRLIRGYHLSWLACQGDSLTPPLWNSQSKSVHPTLLERHPRNEAFVKRIGNLVGRQLEMQVRYPEQPPAEWECDLKL